MHMSTIVSASVALLSTMVAAVPVNPEAYMMVKKSASDNQAREESVYVPVTAWLVKSEEEKRDNQARDESVYVPVSAWFVKGEEEKRDKQARDEAV